MTTIINNKPKNIFRFSQPRQFFNPGNPITDAVSCKPNQNNIVVFFSRKCNELDDCFTSLMIKSRVFYPPPPPNPKEHASPSVGLAPGFGRFPNDFQYPFEPSWLMERNNVE